MNRMVLAPPLAPILRIDPWWRRTLFVQEHGYGGERVRVEIELEYAAHNARVFIPDDDTIPVAVSRRAP